MRGEGWSSQGGANIGDTGVNWSRLSSDRVEKTSHLKKRSTRGGGMRLCGEGGRGVKISRNTKGSAGWEVINEKNNQITL